MGKTNNEHNVLYPHYPVSHDASVLHDLYRSSMRDDDFHRIFTKTHFDQLIIAISKFLYFYSSLSFSFYCLFCPYNFFVVLLYIICFVYCNLDLQQLCALS